jgi:hypothetical protein
MQPLKQQLNSTTRWHELVQDATLLAGYRIDEPLEHYLIVTLDKYINDSNLSSSVLALDFLNAASLTTQQHAHDMRTVGDHCLLLSGLFPGAAVKKNVSLDYFIGMGKTAYHQLASVSPHLKFDNQLFYRLSEEFLGLTHLLRTIRELPKQTHQ